MSKLTLSIYNSSFGFWIRSYSGLSTLINNKTLVNKINDEFDNNPVRDVFALMIVYGISEFIECFHWDGFRFPFDYVQNSFVELIETIVMLRLKMSESMLSYALIFACYCYAQQQAIVYLFVDSTKKTRLLKVYFSVTLGL